MTGVFFSTGMYKVVLQDDHKRAAPAHFVGQLLKIYDLKVLLSFGSQALCVFGLLLQKETAKADLKFFNPNLNAASAPTLPRCNATDTSALLPGLRPTNPFTPLKHKQIDTLCEEPDNPSFHHHSRLSPITGILSLVSSLVTRQTNTVLDPWLSSYKYLTRPWPLTFED